MVGTRARDRVISASPVYVVEVEVAADVRVDRVDRDEFDRRTGEVEDAVTAFQQRFPTVLGRAFGEWCTCFATVASNIEVAALLFQVVLDE